MGENLSQSLEFCFSFPNLMTPLLADSSSLPLMTILIPTLNCSHTLPFTLDSIIDQGYPHYEILVIDGGSTDRTVEILEDYHPSIRFFSVPIYDVYSILNQGIALAKGDYIQVLFSGDSYTHFKTLEHMMNLAVQHSLPDVLYCGTLLREGRSEPKFLFRSLNSSLLRKGLQPTSLQACWFKRELFEILGGFRIDFQIRGGFDFFCRFCADPSLRYIALERAYIDFSLRGMTNAMAIRHFRETGATIYSYFGKWAFMKWLMRQKEMKRLTMLWFKRLRLAFIERKSVN